MKRTSCRRIADEDMRMGANAAQDARCIYSGTAPDALAASIFLGLGLGTDLAPLGNPNEQRKLITTTR